MMQEVSIMVAYDAHVVDRPGDEDTLTRLVAHSRPPRAARPVVGLSLSLSLSLFLSLSLSLRLSLSLSVFIPLLTSLITTSLSLPLGLSLALSLSFSMSLSLSFCLSPSLNVSHYTISLSRSLPLCLSLSISLCLSPSLSLSREENREEYTSIVRLVFGCFLFFYFVIYFARNVYKKFTEIKKCFFTRGRWCVCVCVCVYVCVSLFPSHGSFKSLVGFVLI